MRRLIINADDFGLTPGINRAIAEAHEQGIVTSATLMANAGAFDQAASLARALTLQRSFSVGCHVVLLDGEPLLPVGQVGSLLDPEAKRGAHRFRTTLAEFVLASFRNRLKPAEIEAEATAQMQRLREAGINLSHFDTHKHAHMFPMVLSPLLRAAHASNIRAMRNPFGPLWPLPLTDLLNNPRLWTRLAQLNVLRNFAANFRRQVEAHGLRTTDGSLGVLITGVLDINLFRAIIDGMPEGTWEFVCHPGYNDSDLDKVRTRLRTSRANERDLLTSPDAREILDRRGIQLISYSEL